MNARPTFTFVGAGAIGGFYGTRFLRAGFSVRFLEPHCYDSLCRHGLHVSYRGQVEHFRDIEVHARARDVPASDRVFLCLKTTQTDWIKGDLASLVTPGGAIVSMQNGIEIEAELEPFAAGAPLFAAVCFGAARKTSDAVVEHVGGGAVALAEFRRPATQPSGLLPVLQTELGRCGIPVRVEPDLNRLRWTKLLLNAPLNTLAIILQTTTRDLVRNPASRTLVRDIMHELAAIAAASGTNLPPDLPERLLQGTAQMTPHETSSRAEWAQARPLEIAELLHRAVLRAHQLSIPTPRIELLLGLLACLGRAPAPQLPNFA